MTEKATEIDDAVEIAANVREAEKKAKLMTITGVSEANVDVVWDPPWNPQMIAPEAREKLGID